MWQARGGAAGSRRLKPGGVVAWRRRDAADSGRHGGGSDRGLSRIFLARSESYGSDLSRMDLARAGNAFGCGLGHVDV